MPIEFRCPNCNQPLRVPDTAAGKNAKCPKCSTVLAVPASTSAASPPAPLGPPPQPGFNFGQPVPPPPAPPPPPSSAPQPFNFGSPAPKQPSFNFGGPATPPGPPAPPAGNNPFAAAPPGSPFGAPSPVGGGNPFALTTGSPGAINPYASPQGGYAPAYQPTGDIGHQIVEVGPIINYAVKVWQENLGILIGITLLPILVMMPFLILMWIAMGVAAAADTPELMLVAFVAIYPLAIAANVYLSVGQTHVILKITRGQRTSLGEMFISGKKFLPVLGLVLIAGLALSLGFMLFVIPGLILLFIYWPAYFLVADGKSNVMDSFNKASNITKGNHLTTFLVYLVGMGFALLGEMACFVGLIFAIPLISVMWATAYLMMSGQLAVPGKPMYR